MADYHVGIYLRLSKEDGDKEESNSIESQRRILQDFLHQDLDMELCKEYIDDGYSGTNFNRPGIITMIEDVKSGKINCVLVKDLSRFGRNYLETGKYIQKLFPKLGVRFIALNDNVDTAKFNQEFDMMLPIRNIFNESYSQDISRKVQSSFRSMQRAGAFCGAHTSYGYQKSKKDKHKLVIDPYPSTIVKEIYERYLDGEGQRSIAKSLNDRGILCPTEYKRQNGENYRNSKKLDSTSYWTYSTVHRVLKNEMYKGCMVQNKAKRQMRGKAKILPKEEWIVVERTHEPIIDTEQWEQAQELLKKRTRNLEFDSNLSMFAGFLKCGDCGRGMVKHTYKNSKGEKYQYYSCGTYSRAGASFCTSHRICQNVIEQIVLDDFNTIVSSVSDLKELVESQKKDKGYNLDEKELAMIDEERNKASRLKRECYMDYKEGLLSKEEYLEYHMEYEKRETFLMSKKEVLQSKDNNAQCNTLSSQWVENLLELKRIDQLDRKIIIEFIDSIQIFEKDKEGNQRIKIRYKFTDDLNHFFRAVYEEN